MKDILTKAEKAVLMELAEKCAARPGPENRYTHEDRIMIVYSVLCGMYRINKRKKHDHTPKNR